MSSALPTTGKFLPNITNITSDVGTKNLILSGETVFITCLIGLSIVLLTLYVFVLYILIKHHRELNNAFYKLAIGLGFSDCGLMIQTAFYGSICMMKGGDHWASRSLQVTMSFIEQFTFYSLSYQMLLIGINRYVAIIHFRLYPMIFSDRNMIGYVMVIVVLSTIVPIVYILDDCIVAWSLYSWGMRCSSAEARTMTAVVANIPVAGVPAIYALIFVQYRLINRGMSTAQSADSLRKERRLLLQFSLISAVHFFKQAAFWYVFDIAEPRIATAIITLLLLLDLGINPVLYLVFSSEIRSKIRWFKRTTTNTQVHPLVKQSQKLAAKASMELHYVNHI